MRNIIVLWALVLVISDLPDIACQLLFGSVPTWLFWIKVGIPISALLVFNSVGPGPIHNEAGAMLLILATGRRIILALGMTPAFVQGGAGGFTMRLVEFEALRLSIAVVMVLVLTAIGRRPKDIFLSNGDPGRWKYIGVVVGLVIMLLTFVFFDYQFAWSRLSSRILLVLTALPFGALAAIDEEVRSRAALLPSFVDIAGENHAIFLTTAYFGLAHYFGGVPSGIAGTLVAGGLGWLYAKMMLDTGGLYLSSFSHFMTNVPTVLFWSLGAPS